MNFAKVLFVFHVRRIGQSIVLFMVHKLNIKHHFAYERYTSCVYNFNEGKGLQTYQNITALYAMYARVCFTHIRHVYDFIERNRLLT